MQVLIDEQDEDEEDEEEKEESGSESEVAAGKRAFKCSDCLSSDRPHLARGLCSRCYSKYLRVSRREEGEGRETEEGTA